MMPYLSYRKFVDDPEWGFQLARYVVVGGIVFCIDVGLFLVLIHNHISPLVAATCSYTVAITAHFLLNKFANFRAHERPIHHQALTYGFVAITCWITTLAIIQMGVAMVHLSPLISKLAAIAFNLPIGFLGHRYLTFGQGPTAWLRKFINSLRNRTI